MRDALSLRRVNAFYGDGHVLHDVSFTLREGHLLALLGRNGAGKTTCIHSVSGLLPPRSGSIEVFGEQVARLPPEAIARRGVGLVPQGRRVFKSLTVRENLTVAARRGGAWDLAAVYAAFPALRERERSSAGSLSGGEQQMLAIGRALMTNPRVLLLDEPSEGLAPQAVAELSRVLLRLRESGLSTVLVEHDTRLALSVADDAVTLTRGRVDYEGPAAGIRGDETFLVQHLGVY